MIYVPVKEIKKTVVGQKTLYTNDTMNKSNLDRSSRSVIDEYVTKFELSNLNLEALKVFLENLVTLADDLKDDIEKQRVTLYDQCGDDTPCTPEGRKELERIKEALDDAEDELEDLKKDIDDKVKCLAACYGGGQGDGACTATCEMQCQGACLSNCQQACQSNCQEACQNTVQFCTQVWSTVSHNPQPPSFVFSQSS